MIDLGFHVYVVLFLVAILYHLALALASFFIHMNWTMQIWTKEIPATTMNIEFKPFMDYRSALSMAAVVWICGNFIYHQVCSCCSDQYLSLKTRVMFITWTAGGLLGLDFFICFTSPILKIPNGYTLRVINHIVVYESVFGVIHLVAMVFIIAGFFHLIEYLLHLKEGDIPMASVVEYEPDEEDAASDQDTLHSA
jgi:hypothetical protein